MKETFAVIFGLYLTQYLHQSFESERSKNWNEDLPTYLF